MNTAPLPDTTEQPLDLVVLGGGIAGLAAAWQAMRQGMRVALLEASGKVGGKVRSERRDGYLLEWGPNSFLGSAQTLWKLIDALGLQGEVVAAQKPATRYIYRNRAARPIPAGLVNGSLLSTKGLARLLAEPLMPGQADKSDTVESFASRRLGAEAAHYLVAPFVSGVYAGDPEKLGARDAFPKLWHAEDQRSSIVQGLLTGSSAPSLWLEDASESAPGKGIYSFAAGLQALPKAMAAALGPERVVLHAAVHDLTQHADGFVLGVQRGTDPQLQTLRARQVIVALPARAAASLLPGPQTAALAEVEHARVAVVHFGGPDPHKVAPRGFGVLIPSGEGLRTLGILLPSSMFPGRAPDGHWLHTAFVGGTRDPDAVDLEEETLLHLVRRAQEQAFGLTAAEGRGLPCDFTAVVRWRDAIPQYTVGHRDRMAASLRATEARWPGLTLAGSYLGGISLNDAAASGIAAVGRLQGAA